MTFHMKYNAKKSIDQASSVNAVSDDFSLNRPSGSISIQIKQHPEKPKKNPKPKSRCKLCILNTAYIIRYIFCIIISPLGGILYYYLFNHEWDWAKNEIAHQILFIYTTLIAVVWSTLTVSIIQKLTESHESDIIGSIIYIIFVYCIANIVLCFMLRHKLISKYLSLRMGFIVGIFGHILGFGLKNLSIFILQDSFFKTNHWYRWLYLFIQIFCFILYLWLMSIIRPKLCFAMKKLSKSASLLASQINSSMIDISASTSNRSVVYETDLFAQLMEFADDEKRINAVSIDEYNEDILEHFYDYTKEIDGDAWLISIGFMSVDIIFLLYQHKYLSLTHQEIDENQVIIDDFNWINAIFYAAVFISIYIFWYLYSWLCSYFQVHRDRCILSEFGNVSLRKRKQSDIKNKSLEKHNKCFRFFIECSLKYIVSETVFMFMDGVCGWCFGWSYVYFILNLHWKNMNDIGRIYCNAVFASLFVTIIFIIRMYLFRKGLKKWMRETIKNAINVNSETKELHLSFLNKAKNEALNQQIDNDLRKKYFNFNNMNYNNHAKLFHLLHANWFWRRALAIAYAVPLEQVIDKTMEYYLDDQKDIIEISVKILVAIVLTVMFGATGIWLADIETSRQSQDHQILRFLKGYPVKLHDLIKKHHS
eukprot:137142_1